jgi:hypothetical protein
MSSKTVLGVVTAIVMASLIGYFVWRRRVGCPCQSASLNENKGVLKQINVLWKVCPALRLLVPDWQAFSEADRVLLENNSSHRSTVILAFQRGHLPALTSVIHRYLIHDGLPKPTLDKNYLMDLRERWQIAGNALKRHQESRIFLGKPMELFVANDLENAGTPIVGLAATGARYDVVGRDISAEVKFIGTQDDAFMDIEASSTTGGISGGLIDPYAASDYLLCRIFEAVKQLQGATTQKMAVIVLDD